MPSPKAPSRLYPYLTPHVVFDMLDGAGNVNDAFNVISASAAFRKYNWLLGTPVKNQADNLRGMVYNSRWRTAFNITTRTGDFLTLTSLAYSVYLSKDRFSAIFNSNLPWNIKASKFCIEVSSLAIRAAAGGYVGTAHLLSISLQGYLEMAGLMVGQGAVQPEIDAIRGADLQLQTIVQTATDPDNMFMSVTFITGNPM
jgi:hypothetical protein